MKTPKEILLRRHAPAATRLDAIRADVLKRQCSRSATARIRETSTRSKRIFQFTALLWRGLIAPYRSAWAGLAAIWLALLTFNAVTGARIETPATASAAVSREALASVRERQRLMAEITAGNSTPKEPRPAPGPRSDRGSRQRIT